MENQITPTEFQQKVINSKADITIIAGGMSCGKQTVIEALINSNLIKSKHHLVASSHITNISKLKSVNFLDKRIRTFSANQNHRYNYAGMELGFQYFYKLHEMNEDDFLYLITRCSNEGEKGKVYASINPSQAPKWLKVMCEPWINNPENNGIIKYFLNIGDGFIWGKNTEDIVSKIPKRTQEQFRKSGFNHSIYSMTVINADMEIDAINNSDCSYLKTLRKEIDDGYVNGSWKQKPKDRISYLEKQVEIKEQEISEIHARHRKIMEPFQKMRESMMYVTGEDVRSFATIQSTLDIIANINNSEAKKYKSLYALADSAINQLRPKFGGFKRLFGKDKPQKQIESLLMLYLLDKSIPYEVRNWLESNIYKVL